MIRKTALILCLSLLSAPFAEAGDDPSIQGQLRTDIQAAMEQLIIHRTVVDGVIVPVVPSGTTACGSSARVTVRSRGSWRRSCGSRPATASA